MIRARTPQLSVAVLGAVLMLAMAGGMIVLSASWDGADPVVPVSTNEDIQNKDRVSVAVGANEPYAVWAGGAVTRGIYLAERLDGSWIASLTDTPSSAWSPDIAVANGQTQLVWMQGTNHLNISEKWSLLAQQVGSPAQTLAADVFGEGLPSVVAGDTGFHLVYAAALTKTEGTGQFSPDLYHTYRPFGAPTWRTPTVVVAHGAVIAGDALASGIENARIALSGSGIHIVWEQKQVLPLPRVDHSIWHIAGALQGAQVDWSSPQRMSPTSQRITSRPSIAVGADGNAHVVWTELDSRTNPTQQDVFYRTVDSSVLTRLNPPDQPIRVNGLFPTKATAAIAVEGDLVCTAWHGYYGDASGTEDINLRCSHDAGQKWGIPFAASEGGASISAIFPAIGFDSQGMLHVAWAAYELVDNRFVPYAIQYRSGDVRESHVVFLPLVMRKG